MDIFHQLFLWTDALLISPYRLFGTATAGQALAGFFFGTAILALVAAIIGEYCYALVWLWNRKHYTKSINDMVRMHNVSVEAIRAKDKTTYKAGNKWANEYFGKVFFSQIALFAVSLWPAPFALAWMSTRFNEVEIGIPFTPWSLGYIGVFIILYIIVRVLFSKIRDKLPFFSRVSKLIKEANAGTKVTSWSELHDKEKDEEGASTSDSDSVEQPDQAEEIEVPTQSDLPQEVSHKQQQDGGKA